MEYPAEIVQNVRLWPPKATERTGRQKSLVSDARLVLY
jgi:hypothetical protein